MRRARGFSLTEILVVLALFAVALAISFDSLRSGSRRQPVQSLAQVLAEKFRAAKERAMSIGAPVALVFPAGNTHQSLTVVEGEDFPHPTGSWRWDREFPDASSYLGRWPTDGSRPWSAAPDMPASWTALLSQQSVVGYRGDGTLFSNRSTFDRAVHLVVAQGVTVSSQLDAALTPWTIDLDLGGQIVSHSGVTAGSAVSTSLAAPPAPSSVALLGLGGQHAPHLDSLVPMPVADPSTLPTGIDATVSSDGYLTFEARAVDTDGGPLRCDWTTRQGGSFSSQSPSRCDWDEEKKQWVSRWTFAPPPNANAPSDYSLTCTFTDPTGLVHQSNVRATINLRVIKRQKMAFVSNRRYPIGVNDAMDLFVSNTDGTETKLVKEDGQLMISPRWSPDGSTIVYSRTTGKWSDNSVNFSLCSILRDGSQSKVLLAPPPTWVQGVKASTFSFDGTGVWAMGTTASGTELVKVLLDGSLATSVSSGFPFTQQQCVWNGLALHPLYGHLLMCDSNGQFHYFDPQTSLEYTVSQPSTGWRLVEPTVTPDGQQIYFSCVSPSQPNGSAQREIFWAPLSVDTAAHTVTIGAPVSFQDKSESPNFGIDPDVLFYQKQISATARQLMRYQISTNKHSVLSLSANKFEDDGCVTTYPEVYAP